MRISNCSSLRIIFRATAGVPATLRLHTVIPPSRHAPHRAAMVREFATNRASCKAILRKCRIHAILQGVSRECRACERSRRPAYANAGAARRRASATRAYPTCYCASIIVHGPMETSRVWHMQDVTVHVGPCAYFESHFEKLFTNKQQKAASKTFPVKLRRLYTVGWQPSEIRQHCIIQTSALSEPEQICAPKSLDAYGAWIAVLYEARGQHCTLVSSLRP